MTLLPSEILGTQIKRVVCTAPPAEFYSYGTGFFLQVEDGRFLCIRSSSVLLYELTDDTPLFPAAGWSHTRFRQPEEFDKLVSGNRIHRLIRARDYVYDHAMVVLSNRSLLGNSESGGNRILYVRTAFDEKRESAMQYWDYFTDQPVNHFGDNIEGEREGPCRVSWA